jgi:hypothetical protein
MILSKGSSLYQLITQNCNDQNSGYTGNWFCAKMEVSFKCTPYFLDLPVRFRFANRTLVLKDSVLPLEAVLLKANVPIQRLLLGIIRDRKSTQ